MDNRADKVNVEDGAYIYQVEDKGYNKEAEPSEARHSGRRDTRTRFCSVDGP